MRSYALHEPKFKKINQKLKIQDHFEKKITFFFYKQLAKTMFIINFLMNF